MASPAPPACNEVDVLAAVITVRRVCALVDRGSFAAARWLFADGARWPAGLWRRLRHLRFRSARVVSERGERSSMIKLNVRVATPAATRRHPHAVVHPGEGRRPDGEWLVYRRQAPPIPPRERGPVMSHPSRSGPLPFASR